MLVVVLGGLNTLGAYAERQAGTPADDACKTMLDYFRSSPGGEDYSDAGDRLRYLKGRLDKATANEAVVISECLGAVAEVQRVITAAEMDQLTPDQRAAVVNEHSHTDLDALPTEFRQKVVATAKRLAGQLDQQRHRR
jgi:hypothetical protein